MATLTEDSTDEHIHQKTVVSQVMEKIKDLIASGQFKPGDRMPSEQELAIRFGTGRSSIREAIKIFSHLGVVESKVPKGTFVCERSNISTEAITWALLLGADDMDEVIELRQVIEGQGFLALVRKLHHGDPGAEQAINELEIQVDAMVVAAKESSVEKLILADFRFHELIMKQSSNRLFEAIFQTLHNFTQAEIGTTYKSMADLSEVSQDHREIINAIRGLDVEVSIARHRSHFERIKQLLR